jgi:serine/threonine protein kinase
MVFLEIVHPEQDRLVLSLKDGNYLFPPREMIHRLPKCRLRLEVSGEWMRLEPADSSTSIQQGSRAVTSAELEPGQSVSVAAMQLTLRRHPDTVSAEQNGAPIRPRKETLSVAGHDRWNLLSLYTAGRLGRKDLRHVVTVHRNHRISGTPKGISYILRKNRFLGSEFDHACREAERDLHLRCDRCRRRFEPEYAVLETFRCLECDRRLSCVRRSSATVRARSYPSAPPARYDRLLPGFVLGEYKITELLGVGGYGAVYKALDTRIQRTVALKVFPAGREGSSDVLREARNVAAFPPHPNLVLVYHVGEADGFDYISYEYVGGDSLAYHIERYSKLALEDGLRLMRDVLSALATAHHLGVIHRDVKPDNILLVRVEGRFRARLTDFGLGQRLRQGQGAYFSRTIRGAPQYLAPEQFQFQTSSVSSDLYGVGATFYHVLTGKPPYQGDSDHELATRHVDDPVPSLQEALTSAPRALDHLFRKLLAKDPKNRPASAEEALEILERAVVEHQRHNAWASRRLWTVGTVVLTLVAVLCVWFVLGGGGEWFWTLGRVDPAELSAKVPRDPAPRTPAITPPQPAESGPDHATSKTASEPPAADSISAGSLAMSDAQLHVPTDPQEKEEDTAGEQANDTEAVESAEKSEAETAEPLSPAHPAKPATPPDSRKPAGPPPVVEPVAASTDGTPTAPTTPKQGGASAAQRPSAPPPPLRKQQLPLIGQSLAPLVRWVEQRAETPEADRQRLLYVAWLLTEAMLIEGFSDELRFVQRQPTRTIENALRDGDLSAPAIPIYGSGQVQEWVEQQQELLVELGLAPALAVRLVSVDELAPSLTQGLAGPDSLLEWVRSSDGSSLVVYDHASGRTRPESRAEGYRRISMARLKVTIGDPDAFLALLGESTSRLARRDPLE